MFINTMIGLSAITIGCVFYGVYVHLYSQSRNCRKGVYNGMFEAIAEYPHKTILRIGQDDIIIVDMDLGVGIPHKLFKEFISDDCMIHSLVMTNPLNGDTIRLNDYQIINGSKIIIPSTLAELIGLESNGALTMTTSVSPVNELTGETL